MMSPRRITISALTAVALLATGCGGGSGGGANTVSNATQTSRARAPAAAITVPAEAKIAEHVSATEFPPSGGRSLEQLASMVKAGPKLGLAVSALIPGTQRFAFGLLTSDNQLLYAKSAVYVAQRPSAPARGPYPAPLDSMIPSPPYVSKTVAGDAASAKAVYETAIPFARPGRYSVLTVSKVGSTLVGATSPVDVAASSTIPNVGQRPPQIHTPTAASVGGDLAKIDTRVPHDDMHRVDFAAVIGKRPVALLFATPALCESRTCGPVTDQAVQLEHEFGRRMTFIHNEVFVDNDPNKGYRPQLRAFHLRTEPWLFTFDRHGRIAARLEGAFGVRAFRRAVQAALR